ncbi:ABC transporter substrate-binding protein [Caproicibacter fermentans]|uniref:Sugar ABC transporter substrate-binding protein n=1 Tax=Caproicibacter fermentans TaxID=2576756 RepID=A0A7G8T663_9FIRM|nr:sugar ABC transporter substrate-binding protein [Caproicibacter fermentans]QNK39104.1 sugar ABC transporter substrate-binding protein [Caproicibacter fermentans]
MKKKLLPLALAAAVLAGTMAGCGSSSAASSAAHNTAAPAASSSSSAASSTPSAENVTLNFAIWDSNQEKGLRKIADNFEAANPGIKIKINVTGWSDYWTMLEAGATGGSLPDVFWMHSNEIYRYGSNGMLLDLTDRISKSDKFKLSDYPDQLSKIYNISGKQYAVPKDYDTIGLWYNKTLFDKAGLKYPDETWTWDTLYNAAKKLTKNGVYGILTPLHNQEGFYNFIYQNNGKVISDDKKKSGYDDPATIQAMEYYTKFIREKLSPQIFGDKERAEAMENGLCAMGFFGSWNLSGFAENQYMAKNFDVTVLPQGKTRATIFNGLGNAISANTKHPEEAWRFVEYLSTKEAQEEQAKLGVAISAYNGAADLWVSSNKTFHVKSFIDMVKYAVIRPYSNKTTAWEDRAYETLKPCFTGKQTVKQACQNTAKQMNEALAAE